MALKHSFEKRGNLFFKYRGQIPLFLFAGAVPAIYLSDIKTIESTEWLEEALLGVSILVSIVGFIIRFVTIGKTQKQTSGRNTWGHEAKFLNQTGIYSMVRHPLYLGNFFIWMGIVAYTGNPWFGVIVVLLFWLYYERIIYAEEVFLEREFGDVFLKWAVKVPAIIPSLKHYEPSSVKFSVKTCLRREYPGISAAIIGFIYVDFVRDWVAFGAPKWKLNHGIALFVALLISFVLRTLKHYTMILWEADRS